MVVLMVMTVMPVGGYTLKRVSVHDPSVVWEPSTQYYYIFGSHRGVARSKDMMNWSSTSASWGRITDAGTTISGVTNDKAFVTNMTKTVTVGNMTYENVYFDEQTIETASEVIFNACYYNEEYGLIALKHGDMSIQRIP